jgi:hypothetical protein
MRALIFFVSIPIIFSSCLSYSRMTSPEVMEPTERAWMFGAQPIAQIERKAPIPNPQNPSANSESKIDIEGVFTPVIAYRSGSPIGEWGITLHQQAFYPAATVDYKHKIMERESFHLSGDVAATIGEAPGMQYDLLFGNRTLYGQLGYKYYKTNGLNNLLDFSGDNNNKLIVGIGTEINDETPLGFQLMYARPILYSNPYSEPSPQLALGIKLEFRRTKKKYRN